MGRLEDAVSRLERAVARLEKAAMRTVERPNADYMALRDASESVAARLDAAILRLDRMLEG